MGCFSSKSKPAGNPTSHGGQPRRGSGRAATGHKSSSRPTAGAVAPPAGAAPAGKYRAHGDVMAPADANVTTGFHFNVRWPVGELLGLTGPGGVLGILEGGGKDGALVAKGADLAGDAQWIEETLRVHNELRARHGSPPLQWDPKCASAARQAADACAKQGKLFHNHCQEYGHGQNIFAGSPAGMFGAKSAVESWYNEIDKPGYSRPAAPGTGHFTAVVWLATTHVGMNCDSLGKGFIVANYTPAGNMMPADPHYLRNVLPLGTPMQTRRKTCARGKNVTTSQLTDEVREILNSVPHEEIKAKVVSHLRAGGRVDIEFKPPPKGSIKVKFHRKGGGSSSMHGTW